MPFMLLAEDKIPDAQALLTGLQQTKSSFEQRYQFYRGEISKETSQKACNKGWNLLFQDNNKIKAMDEFNKAWRFDPDNFQAYWGSGIIYGMVANENSSSCEQYLKDSIRLLEKSLELVVAHAAKRNVTFDLVDAYNRIGIFYLNATNKEKADFYFAKSENILVHMIKEDPSLGRAHYLLAIVFFYNRDISQAVKEAELATKNGFMLPDDFKDQIQKYVSSRVPKVNDPPNRNPYDFLLFPINIVPDIVTNTILCFGKGINLVFEYPSEPAWGVMLFMLAPFSGIYHGFGDAVEGYPFWSVFLLRKEIFSPFSRDEK